MLHPEPRWATVKRVLDAALDQTENERVAFLQATCSGDEALIREVQSLLTYQGQADSFLETPAAELVARTYSEVAEATLIGRAISHYQIDSLLGAGGMGEVYLARDPRLDRTVALKILPLDFALNEDRMQRFTREARAASALNHPNVAVIHDV